MQALNLLWIDVSPVFVEDLTHLGHESQTEERTAEVHDPPPHRIHFHELAPVLYILRVVARAEQRHLRQSHAGQHVTEEYAINIDKS